MLAPHGVKPGEFDMVFAGATSARASALQAGAVDAAILLPPFNFHAVAAGFNDLGLTVDYAPELPFSGTVVNKTWAASHPDILQADARRTCQERRVVLRSDKNRAEAIAILSVGIEYQARRRGEVLRLLPQEQVLRAAPGRVSRKKLNALVAAMQSLGDLQAKAISSSWCMPAVTKISD